MKTSLFSTYCITALLLLQAAAAFSDADQPNVVLILADDMGYGDIKAFNPESKIPTPNLDKLAHEGMVFTDAHSGGSTCVPSRYALLTGRFSARKENLKVAAGPVIEEGRATIASMLRDSGYRTAMVGKWHQGFDQKAQREGKPINGSTFDYSEPLTGGPMDRGFDSFFGMHASLDIPPYFYIRAREPTRAPTDTILDSTSVGGQEGWNRIQGAFWRGGDISPDFKHIEVTPRFTAEACEIIETHDGKKPLFLYVALPSPHTPWLPAEEFIGKSGVGMYGDFVVMVDNAIGQILTSIGKAGLHDDTVVLFSSDNGPVWYDKDAEKFGHHSTGVLRGAKGSVWEGGHRVPFIVKWPGKVRAGTRSDHLVSFVDIFATLAALSDHGRLKIGTAEDSISFLPVLLQPEGKHEKRLPILHAREVIRDGDWKLIATEKYRGFTAERGQKFGIELYNMRIDVSEEVNLAGEMPEKVEMLRAKIQQILDD